MASIKSLFRENFVLVVGIVLPVILVLLFFIAMVVPNRLVPPPQYDFLFTIDEYQKAGPPYVNVRYDVSNNALRATVFVDDKQNYHNIPRLFRFEMARRSAQEIAVDIPGSEEDMPDDKRLFIEDVAGLRLDSRLTAPDGYEFRNSQYYNRGLFTELFVHGSARYQPSLAKQGASTRINLPSGRYNYYNVRFLGWVIPQP